MTVFVLIALIHDWGFSRSTTGLFQMEFTSKEACQAAKIVIEHEYSEIKSIKCVEFKK